MAQQVTNYKCLSCTADLKFSAKTGKLECEYCGSAYTVEEIEAQMAEKNAKAEEAKSQADEKEASDKANDKHDYAKEAWLQDGMKAYQCPQCGANIVCDETTATTSCPYCGSQTMIPGQFAGMLKPNFVIPFKKTKNDAEKALSEFYGGKILLPSSFKNKNHISDIKGVYVPFWLFDANTYGSALYEGIKRHTYREDKYEVTITKYYESRRRGSDVFKRIPTDASKNMPDDLMDSIEPFDYTDLKEFSKAYLAGFLADKYDVSEDENKDRAKQRAFNTLSQDLRNSVTGYDSVRTLSENINVDLEKAEYAMLPVWLLSTRWDGKNFLFAMNGQTGKVVGDLPCDNGKYWMIVIGSAILLTVIATNLVEVGDDTFTQIAVYLIPIIIAFVIGAVLKGQLKTVELAVTAGDFRAKPLQLSECEDVFLRQTESRREIQQNNNNND